MQRRYLNIIMLIGGVFIFGVLSISPGSAQGGESGVEIGGIRRSTHSETGKLGFLGADPRAPISVPGAQNPGFSPENRGLAILNVYGPEFGLQNAARELRKISQRAIGTGQSSVRYQQVYQNIPVVGGELIVHMTDQGGLISISGEISPDLNLSTSPQIGASSARSEALNATAKAHGVSTTDSHFLQIAFCCFPVCG